MKLELKHLAPYLPYDLEVIFLGDGHKHQLVGLDFNTEGLHLISPFGDYDRGDIRFTKLILRPLSDITRDIDVNGEKFMPIKILEEMSVSESHLLHLELRKTIGKLTIPIDFLNKLFEWHFDVFGLIEKGLAIDKNTL